MIVGPTGSGKTGIAIEIAKKIGGEVISADSRTVYKYMDIGTAKPSFVEREGIPHWGFDLVEPGDRFTVKDWKDYAADKINEIESRGKIAMVVGGTGLYVDALVFDYKFSIPGKGYGLSRGKCDENLNGKYGVLKGGNTKKYVDRKRIIPKYKMFGIAWDKNELRTRLNERAEQMFNDKLYKEVELLVKKYGWDNLAMKSNIYEFAWSFLNGEISREEAVERTSIADWHLAKRQLTWLKRNENIVWLSLEKVKEAVIKCIQNEQGK